VINKLLQKVDIEKVAALAEQVDLNQVIKVLSKMKPQDLAQMMQQLNGQGQKTPAAPPINSDFYEIRDSLTEDDKAKLARVRQFMETEVRPVINEYWDKGEFPYELVPKVAQMINETIGEGAYCFPHPNPLLMGMHFVEMARVDPSITTFFGVHWGLCMGSIYMFGSEEQKAKWLPPMQRFEKIGSWALTEPEVGSAAAAGLMTTARREGDTWVINGQKKWSGNATFAQVNVIWARDVADNQVKGFLVELGTPGYTVEKLHGKIAKRVVENVLITLTDCRVTEASRLPGVNSFRDVSRQLGLARSGVAWEAMGIAQGAYEHALNYANNRQQFGRPIAAFQLVQHGLVQMLANITAMQTMLLRLAQMEIKHGKVSHEQASLAKMFCSEKMREVVATARGLLGGNGILLEYEVARLFADAEAVYSYEGTHEMNTLIVGRAITGQSAFV